MEIQKQLNNLRKTQSYLFKKVSDYPPIIKSNIVKTKFSLGNFSEKVIFKTFNVKHGKTNSVGYIFEKTAYISDSDDLSIINIKELKNLKYLILDCLKFEKHPTHFNLEEALFVHRQLEPKKTILTNLSNDIDYDFLLKRLPKNVLPAYDGLQLKL